MLTTVLVQGARRLGKLLETGRESGFRWLPFFGQFGPALPAVTETLGETSVDGDESHSDQSHSQIVNEFQALTKEQRAEHRTRNLAYI